MNARSLVFIQDTYNHLRLTSFPLVAPTETEPVSLLPTMPRGLEECYRSDPQCSRETGKRKLDLLSRAVHGLYSEHGKSGSGFKGM